MTNTATSRQPAVAGTFYPADPQSLRRMIRQMLDEATPPSGPAPRAIIAPHAGYIYSGPVAATAYSSLRPVHDQIHRVVLLGPSHRVPFIGLAVSNASEFLTPLGAIPLDTQAIQGLLQLPQVQALDSAHAYEHSLEVHLPFLQSVLDDFTLIPIVVGDTDPGDVAEVLEQFWDDPATLFVISSDLSHYHDYATAQRMDSATSKAIETLNSDAIGFEDACGRNPVLGMLEIARRHGLTPHTVDLRNSGDTAGPRDQVVGYGAYTFT
jgi:AmmeMemoRadiSam system protein B